MIYTAECHSNCGYEPCWGIAHWLSHISGNRISCVLTHYPLWDMLGVYPLAFQAERVLSLPASVHLSVHKLNLVGMISHRFELESPNLHQTCIMECFHWYWKYGLLTLTFKVILAILIRKFYFSVQWIFMDLTYNDQICTKYAFFLFSQLVMKIGVIDLDLQGYLAIWNQEMAFNVALVHWSRPRSVNMSQTWSCLSYSNVFDGWCFEYFLWRHKPSASPILTLLAQ